MKPGKSIPGRQFFCFYISALFFLFLVPAELSAQYSAPQNDVWAMGYGEGVNFLPGPGPVSLPSSSNTYEGSATVCDNTGALLFYSAGSATGTFVYDRTGAVMPNGSGIVPWPTFSCTQASEIVPVLSNPNQYYVFSLEQGGSSGWGGTPGFCHLYYCIVDMTLNGGLGDVIASTRATPLDSGLCEKMTAVAGNDCNIWLLTHEKDLPIFKAYSITTAGISAPVLSTSTGEIPSFVGAYKIGTIKVSPNRTMVANVMLNGVYGGGDERLELLNFDPSTGLVTGCQILNSFGNQYDGDFSPDNSKFYVRVLGGSMYQYDLSLLPSLSAVVASQNIVYTSADWGGQMKLGPDGKIYAQTNVGYLDCINSPNLYGSLCNYTAHAVAIGSTGIGMPNMEVVAAPITPDTTYASHDTTFCPGEGFVLTAPAGYTGYTWNTGATTTTLNVTTAGTYWVVCTGSCSLSTLIDTFHVAYGTSCCNTISLVDSVHLCPGDTATLHAVIGGPDSVISITWSPATGLSSSTISSPLLTATTSGWYHITVDAVLPGNLVINGDFSAGNTGFSSSYIYSPPPSSILYEGYYSVYNNPYGVHTGFTSMGDHTTGTGNMMIINGGPGATSVWCQTIPVTPNTMYDFSAWFANCSSITVGAYVPILQFQVNGVLLGTPTTASAPVGTWANFFSTWFSGTATSATICIYDETTATTGNDFAIDDISFKQLCIAKDSVYVQIIAPDTTYTHTDTSICSLTGGSITLTAASGYTTDIWSTGSSATSITVSSAGTYWVVGTTGCSERVDTFHVLLAPPVITSVSSDSSACIVPGSITLNGPTGYTTQTWNTGSTAGAITVTTAGTYWVTSTLGCTEHIDTFHVTFDPVTTTSVSSDTSGCVAAGDITLNAPTGYTAQTWSTGSTAGTISISSAGTYWVASTIGCAMLVDTFHVSFIPTPIVGLGRDTAICAGATITIGSSQPGEQYSWSTGSTDSTINVSAAGTYILTITLNGCSGADTITVSEMMPPVVNLGPDTVICTGQVLQLNAGANDTAYAWSNGNKGQTVYVSETGVYWVTVFNKCGVASDSIDVASGPCDVGLPTAFSPNGDGANDILYIRGSGVSAVDLKVFNRFGQLVFETTSMSIGWDGRFDGTPQEVDVYAYVLKALLIDGTSKMIKGNITLLR